MKTPQEEAWRERCLGLRVHEVVKAELTYFLNLGLAFVGEVGEDGGRGVL